MKKNIIFKKLINKRIFSDKLKISFGEQIYKVNSNKTSKGYYKNSFKKEVNNKEIRNANNKWVLYIININSFNLINIESFYFLMNSTFCLCSDPNSLW